MIGSTVLSMSIRQSRHLQEVPSDFFRLPVFILTSTFFLMPVRFLGFLRMAHASGWGTRDGAYTGGDDDGPVAAQHPPTPTPPPRDIFHGTGTSTSTLAVRERRTTHATTPAPARRRHHYNPKAAIPYLIAIAILSLEALLYV